MDDCFIIRLRRAVLIKGKEGGLYASDMLASRGETYYKGACHGIRQNGVSLGLYPHTIEFRVLRVYFRSNFWH